MQTRVTTTLELGAVNQTMPGTKRPVANLLKTPERMVVQRGRALPKLLRLMRRGLSIRDVDTFAGTASQPRHAMFGRASLRVLLSLILCLFLSSWFFIWTIFPSATEKSTDCPCDHPSRADHNGDPYRWSCSPGQHRLAIVVPFRERTNELLKLVPHLYFFLQRQGVCHQVFVVNQVDKYRFNRGMLINVGFLLASNESTYMAMHDVDLLPLNDQLSYRFPSSDGPFHLTAPSLHPKYHYDKYVGGILLIQNRHFVEVNGFSTRYWGWGLEDDEFYTRLREASLKIYRPHNISTDSSNSFLHLHDQSVHKRDTAKLFNQREVTRKRDRQTGLNTTRYQLLQVHRLTVEGVPFCVFDVALHCDLNSTPWCQRSSPTAAAARRQAKEAKPPANGERQ